MTQKQNLPASSGGQRASFLMHPFETLHQDMDRLLGQYFPNRLSSWFPEGDKLPDFAKMDVTEADKSINITLDVPGLDEKNIEITLSGDLLTIQGSRENVSEEKKENYQRMERSFGSFLRRVELPCEVDADKIKATIEKGVLNLRLPKSARAKAKERKIDIKAS